VQPKKPSKKKKKEEEEAEKEEEQGGREGDMQQQGGSAPPVKSCKSVNGVCGCSWLDFPFKDVSTCMCASVGHLGTLSLPRGAWQSVIHSFMPACVRAPASSLLQGVTSCPTCGHGRISHYCWWNRYVANPIKFQGYKGEGGREGGRGTGVRLGAGGCTIGVFAGYQV
jgi:hypothetical protein